MFLGATLCVAMAFTSCKSSESAYRKAYLQAQQRTQAQATVAAPAETTTVAPVTTVSATDTRVVDNTDNAVVREERVTVVNGAGLQQFSVVVGSFSLKANAEGLQQQLKNQGLDAQLAYNAEKNMYRVVASTFANKVDAVQSRDQLRANFPDAWLLYAK